MLLTKRKQATTTPHPFSDADVFSREKKGRERGRKVPSFGFRTLLRRGWNSRLVFAKPFRKERKREGGIRSLIAFRQQRAGKEGGAKQSARNGLFCPRRPSYERKEREKIR